MICRITMKNDQNVIIYSTLEQRSLPKKRKIELHAGVYCTGEFYLANDINRKLS